MRTHNNNNNKSDSSHVTHKHNESDIFNHEKWKAERSELSHHLPFSPRLGTVTAEKRKVDQLFHTHTKKSQQLFWHQTQGLGFKDGFNAGLKSGISSALEILQEFFLVFYCSKRSAGGEAGWYDDTLIQHRYSHTLKFTHDCNTDHDDLHSLSIFPCYAVCKFI